MSKYPYIKEARENLECLKGLPSRTRYVNNVPYQMVEVSTKTIQKVIDLLREAGD